MRCVPKTRFLWGLSVSVAFEKTGFYSAVKLFSNNQAYYGLAGMRVGASNVVGETVVCADGVKDRVACVLLRLDVAIGSVPAAVGVGESYVNVTRVGAPAPGVKVGCGVWINTDSGGGVKINVPSKLKTM